MKGDELCRLRFIGGMSISVRVIDLPNQTKEIWCLNAPGNKSPNKAICLKNWIILKKNDLGAYQPTSNVIGERNRSYIAEMLKKEKDWSILKATESKEVIKIGQLKEECCLGEYY